MSSLRSASPNTRFLKSSTMRGRPSFRLIFGSQPRYFLALLMSGFRMWGSSSVLSLKSICALGSMTSFTTCRKSTCPRPGEHAAILQTQSEQSTQTLSYPNIQTNKLTSASSSIVNSPGFPRLKGPIWSPSISRIKPSTWSFAFICQQNFLQPAKTIHMLAKAMTITATYKNKNVVEGDRDEVINRSKYYIYQIRHKLEASCLFAISVNSHWLLAKGLQQDNAHKLTM